MEKELRRNQILLVTLGTGVIILGVWSVLKVVLFFLAGPPLDFGVEGDPKAILLAEIIVFTILGLLMLADIALRVYIGRRARAEGMGVRQKNRYLYLTGFLIIYNIVGLLFSVYYAYTGNTGGQSRLDYAASCLIELISTVLLIRLFVAVKRVRRLRGELEG